MNRFQDSNLQTRLGLLFIDSLSRGNVQDENSDIRERFRNFLCLFEAYDSNVLLRRLDTDSKLDGTLLQERAMLLGRVSSLFVLKVWS